MQLIDYIRGKKHGKEANQLEREAMNDPFLQDAIDGLDAVQADHAKTIEELEKLLQQKIKTSKPVIFYRIWTTGIAAAIVLLLGIGSMLYLHKKEPATIAETKTKTVTRQHTVENAQPECIVQTSPKAIAYHTSKKQVEPAVEMQQLTEVNEKVDVVNTASATSVVSIQSELLTPAPVKTDQIAFKSIASDKMDSVRELALNNALSGKLSGVVVDETNTPMAGATIRIRGANSIGTVTDMYGKFTIPKSDKKSDKLVASSIGYIPQEVPVSTDSTIIKLKPNDLTLSEVVVVGYGARKKSDMAGSISSKPAKNDRELNFGEKEFKVYFEHYRTRSLCDDKGGTVRASFTINPAGKPTNLTIIKSTCDDLSRELIRLLNDSPAWTETNQKVEFKIVVK